MGQAKATKTENILKTMGAYAAVFFCAFAIALLTASSFTPVENSDATTEVNTIIRNTGTYAQISADSEMVLNLEATSGGATVIGSQVVTAITNSATGYQLYISTGSTDASSRLMYKDGASTSDYYLSPITGTSSNVTTTSPVVLSNATANTWGYTVQGLYGNGSSDDISASSYFVGMPIRGYDNLIRTVTSAVTDSTSSNAQTTVYYGAKANTSLPSGEYKATVTYTALVESNDDSISVVPYAIPQLAAGETITIATPVYAVSGLDLGTISVTVGGVAATDCARKEVDDSMAVTLSCTLPAQSAVGEYDVAVSFNGYTGSAEDAVLYYVPWEKLQYMQDMTAYACDEVETPTAFNDNSSSPVYNYGPISSSSSTVLTDTNVSSALSTYWSGTASDRSNVSYLSYGRVANINTGVPEKELIDVRDGNSYRIRKLADGNCWMTENLRLVFSDDAGTIGATPSSVTRTAKGAATYTRTYDGETYGPSITVAASHKIDEAYSNVGKNAVGGSSASNWSSSLNSNFAYTEWYDSSKNGASGGGYQSYWGSTDGASTKHSTSSTGIGWTDTSSNNSNTYARSLYNSATRNDCTYPGDINASNNYSYSNCFIRDGDTQTIGTYYNWQAATAGTGTKSVTSGTMTDSICPAGWQLPVNGDSSTDKSWAKLINGTYGDGIASGGNVDARNNVTANGTATGTGTSGYYQTLAGYHIWALTAQMRMAPLSLPFAGYYYMGGTVNYVGGEGVYWSSTASSASYARRLLAYAGRLYPQSSGSKGYGLPVRCVAQ